MTKAQFLRMNLALGMDLNAMNTLWLMHCIRTDKKPSLKMAQLRLILHCRGATYSWCNLFGGLTCH